LAKRRFIATAVFPFPLVMLHTKVDSVSHVWVGSSERARAILYADWMVMVA
jgi:hypothetical protein